MTEFSRRGHWRTNQYGTTHWVSESVVNRDHYCRPSYSLPTPQTSRESFLDRHPEFVKARRLSSCFVEPNAICPVCGESVFYFQNEHGSRVYFDELGPPWPKHPCTIAPALVESIASVSTGSAPLARRGLQMLRIAYWQRWQNIDLTAEFALRHGCDPLPLATVESRIDRDDRAFLTLRVLEGRPDRKVLASCRSLPKCCTNGYIVAIHTDKISLFDTVTSTVIEVATECYHSESEFVAAMEIPNIRRR